MILSTFCPDNIFFTELHIGNSTTYFLPSSQILSHDSIPSTTSSETIFFFFFANKYPNFVFLDFKDEQVKLKSPIPESP